MSNKLKIYACSGIGDTNRAKEWISEGTTAAENTQAMNAILAIINSLAVDLRFPENLTPAEKVATLNTLDFYSVCFYYSRLYRDDTETLASVGECIAKYQADGGFNSDNAEPEWHDNRIDGIIDAIDTMLQSGDITKQKGDFAKWWKSTVVKGNVVGLREDGKVGATVTKDYGDLNKYLYDGGTYFLWLYIPEDKVSSLPYRIQRKRRKQQEVYNYCRKCFCPQYGGIYGSEADMQRIIRNGIKENFNGKTPEQVCAFLVEKENTGFVMTAAALASIISACVTLLLGILGLVLNYAQAVAVAKYAVPEDPESGCPEEDDIQLFGSAKNVWLWIAGGALALLYFWKKNK